MPIPLPPIGNKLREYIVPLNGCDVPSDPDQRPIQYQMSGQLNDCEPQFEGFDVLLQNAFFTDSELVEFIKILQSIVPLLILNFINKRPNFLGVLLLQVVFVE